MFALSKNEYNQLKYFYIPLLLCEDYTILYKSTNYIVVNTSKTKILVLILSTIYSIENLRLASDFDDGNHPLPSSTSVLIFEVRVHLKIRRGFPNYWQPTDSWLNWTSQKKYLKLLLTLGGHIISCDVVLKKWAQLQSRADYKLRVICFYDIRWCGHTVLINKVPSIIAIV